MGDGFSCQMAMGILLNPELERRIAEKVSSGEYRSADEVVEKGLDLLEGREEAGQRANEHPGATPSGQPVWEIAAEIARTIPQEDAESIPRDLAMNHDHFLYGARKRSE